ncbi:MAG: hypothetical protein H6830_03000 [Planctomycetes bacterium]|nr:hypothetical protein [Planctomycetota bacterium]MCB9910089.1 hypothetical protein [Planctomycetota bacterium]MCB9913364.1 hypothetical protein [Planctomycetota bacterium]HPF15627.1 sigma factor [Planctomycetota bacterium]HRV81279.1 sigma factor [Planctomycetota bacterium]
MDPSSLWSPDEYRELLAYAARRMGRQLRSLIEPEDLLQDAWLAAWTEITTRGKQLAPTERGAWLRGIVHHRILRLVRDLQPRTRPRRATALPASMLQTPEGLLDSAVTLHLPCDRDLRRERLASACRSLGRLDSKRRTLLVLRSLLGVSWPVIGFVTGRQPAAARKMHERCLRDLQRLPARLEA